MVLTSLVDGSRVLNYIMQNKMDDVLNDFSDIIGIEVPLIPFALSTAILCKKCLTRPDVNCLKLLDLFTLCIEFCLFNLFD